MAGKYFKIPFALSGDRSAIPDAAQPDGSVSFTQGFTLDYELENTDQYYKPVPREETNALYYDITEAVGEVQLYGAALWSANMAPYPINARVAYAGKYWRSKIAANSDEPGVGAGWDDISTAQNIALFGIGTNTAPNIGNIDDPAKPGGLYLYNPTVDAGTAPGIGIYGVVLVQPVNGALTRQTFREVNSVSGQTGFRTWERQINVATLSPWGLTTGLDSVRIDVASASTVNLTTAAPTTRHINITGTTAITGFTVAAGQCYFVRFAGALTLTNGAGLVTNRGANITTSAGDTCIIRATAENTVEILCGDFLSEAAVGTRGQTWQDVTASRAPNVTYTNTTERSIFVMVSLTATPGGSETFIVDGIVVGKGSQSAGVNANISAIIPRGSTYSLTTNAAQPSSWTEIR